MCLENLLCIYSGLDRIHYIIIAEFLRKLILTMFQEKEQKIFFLSFKQVCFIINYVYQVHPMVDSMRKTSMFLLQFLKIKR